MLSLAEVQRTTSAPPLTSSDPSLQGLVIDARLLLSIDTLVDLLEQQTIAVGNRIYRYSKRMRNNAAKVFTLLRCEYTALTPQQREEGIKLSYHAIQELLFHDVGRSSLIVACRLLEHLHFIEAPSQDATRKRDLIWHITEARAEVHNIIVTAPSAPQRAGGPDVTTQVSIGKGQPTNNTSNTAYDSTLVRHVSQDVARGHMQSEAANGCGPVASHRFFSNDGTPSPQPEEPATGNGADARVRARLVELAPSMRAYFSSPTWSPHIVASIIERLGLMPKKSLERAIVLKGHDGRAAQAAQVYEQWRDLAPDEACRRLIMTLEYMMRVNPFWRERYARGESLVKSLGSNHNGHCTAMKLWADLTKAQWSESLLYGDYCSFGFSSERLQIEAVATAQCSLMEVQKDWTAYSWAQLVEMGEQCWAVQQQQQESERKEASLMPPYEPPPQRATAPVRPQGERRTDPELPIIITTEKDKVSTTTDEHPAIPTVAERPCAPLPCWDGLGYADKCPGMSQEEMQAVVTQMHIDQPTRSVAYRTSVYGGIVLSIQYRAKIEWDNIPEEWLDVYSPQEWPAVWQERTASITAWRQRLRERREEKVRHTVQPAEARQRERRQ